MATSKEPSSLHQAANLIRNKQTSEAARILAAFLKANPNSEEGWFLLSFAVQDVLKKKQCLQRVIQINPNNARAQERFLKLQSALQRPLDQESTLSPSSQEPQKKKRKKPRWTIYVITILVLTILAGGGYLGIRRLNQNATTTPPQAVTGQPTALPTQTPQPSSTPTSSATAIPTEPPPPPPTLSPTLVPPTLLPTNALASPQGEIALQMDYVQNQVSTIRELSIMADTPRFVILQSKVHGILEGMLLARYSRDEVKDQARVLSTLGLIEPTYDLYSKILNSLGEGLGGFYIPWTDELYLIGESFSGVEKFVYAHEYVHTLVDQHYHLEAVGVYPECLRETDRCAAISALVEGDATALMYQWLEAYASEEDITDITEANFTPADQVITSQDFPPPYTVREVTFRYIDGKTFVEHLFDLGGWGQVNAAYENLPQSTEQILHPEKYLAGETPVQVDPRPLGDLLGEGWRRLASETLGELTTQMILGYGANYLVQLDPETASHAAAGWGGDNCQVYYRGKSNQSVLVVHWVWDSLVDADEFWAAMLTFQNKRYLGRKVADSDYDCWVKINEHYSCIYRTTNNTLWLIAPNMEMIDLLLDQHPEFK